MSRGPTRDTTEVKGNCMNRIPQAAAMVLLVGALAANAQAPGAGNSAGRAFKQGAAENQIRILLDEFLAHVDEAAMHERFWADELVYTGSSGAKRTKQEIVASVKKSEEEAKAAATPAATAPESAATAEPATVQKPAGRDFYAAEEVQVRQFGAAMVLNFRLVHHLPDGKTDLYRNSGVFVRKKAGWQVVSWQATKISEDKKQ